MNLFGAALDAPLMAVRKRWPNTIHAIDLQHVVGGWDRGTFWSACGLRGLRLVGTHYDEALIAAPWPPRLRGLPEDTERCRECWELTGKRRPRSTYTSKEVK
jgi:hypothetical protein